MPAGEEAKLQVLTSESIATPSSAVAISETVQMTPRGFDVNKLACVWGNGEGVR